MQYGHVFISTFQQTTSVLERFPGAAFPDEPSVGNQMRGAGGGSLNERRSRERPRVAAQCANCSAWFMALKYPDGRLGKFCTIQCCGAHAAATGKFRGDKNPRWLGGVASDNMRYRQRQKERWPEREAARRAVRSAIRSGRLVRQPCERCGTTVRVEGHHDDYGKPLDVRWLCPAHHDQVHAELRAAS